MPVQTLPSAGGFVFDEVPQELPDGAFSSGLNMRFQDGYAQRFSGHSSVLTAPAAAAYHIVNYPTSTANYWIHATLAGAWADTGAVQTDITGTTLTGTADNRFTSCVLGGVYVQNNQAQVPMFWGGDVSLNLASLTGWNSGWRCKAMRSFKAYLLALNVTKAGVNFASMVKWSDASEPGSLPASWAEADATLDAGEQDLAETPDAVVDGLALGDVFVVYKERSMFALQFTGGNEIFRVARLPGDYGLLTQNCAVNFPGGHVMLTQGLDVMTHAGGEPVSILKGKMRRWLQANVDSTNYGRSFVVANHPKSEVWVCFPGVGATACTRALVWNYTENSFGIRELPNATAGAFGPLSSSAAATVDSISEIVDDVTTVIDQSDISAADKRLILASTAPGLYLMDKGTKFAGAAFTARLERTGLTFGDASRIKVLRSIMPRVDAPTGTVLTFQMLSSNSADQGYTAGPLIQHTVGASSDGRVYGFASGKFLGVRVLGASGAWRIKSMDFDVVMRGAF